MTELMQFLEMAGVFLLGLIVRLMLAVLVVALLATPILIGLEVYKQLASLWRRALGLSELAGLPWREGIYYAPGHTWLKPEGTRGVRLGIDGLAQRLLRGVESVALPRPGDLVRRGETLAEIVSGSHRVPIASPLDGRVTRVNQALAEHPHRLDRDPYVRGWLVSVAPAAQELGRFLKGEAARDWFRSEGARLARFFEHDLGLAAADGGEPVVPEAAALSDERWKSLTESFLRAA